MNLEQRLTRLEQNTGTNACIDCGYTPGAPVVFTVNTEPLPRSADNSALDECKTCGRLIHLHFTVILNNNLREGDGNPIHDGNPHERWEPSWVCRTLLSMAAKDKQNV